MVRHTVGMEPELITERAEQIVRDAAEAFRNPGPGECLACFTARQLDAFGCDGTHRFAVHFRDRTAPRATALLRRLAAMGACCCDCEMFMNAYEPAARLWTPGRRTSREDEDGVEEWEDPQPPSTLPACSTVPRGSTAPCDNWNRIS